MASMGPFICFTSLQKSSSNLVFTELVRKFNLNKKKSKFGFNVLDEIGLLHLAMLGSEASLLYVHVVSFQLAY